MLLAQPVPSPKFDLSGADYPNSYKGGKKVLMNGADERHLLTDNGSFFSTGSHPVETLLPMYHLDKAGFAFDVATVSGNPVSSSVGRYHPRMAGNNR